jgi:type IX secretion system PorP/SprF family membrane protein
MKKLFFLLTAVISVIQAAAQDTHFSQFYFSPLTINPALTGMFNGTLRLDADYRNQWQNVLGGSSYQTYSGAVDLSVKSGDYNRFGIGLVFMSDRAGTSQLATNYYEISFSYALALTEKQNSYISTGLQLGLAQSSINTANLTFGDQWANNAYNPFLPSGENLNISSSSYIDASAGILWYHMNSNRSNQFFGLSILHFNQPEIYFLNYADASQLYMKYNIYTGLETPMGRSADFLPMALLSFQGPADEIDAGFLLKFILANNANNTLNAFSFGPLLRVVGGSSSVANGESIIAAARLDLGNLSIGLSYDVNISELTPASSYEGGPEIALQYIIGSNSREGGVKNFCPTW